MFNLPERGTLAGYKASPQISEEEEVSMFQCQIKAILDDLVLGLGEDSLPVSGVLTFISLDAPFSVHIPQFY